MPLEKSVLRSEAFDGPRRVPCLPPLDVPASTSHPETLSEFCPHSSLETRLSPFSVFLITYFKYSMSLVNLTQGFGGRRVCHGEGSPLERRISALSWPPLPPGVGSRKQNPPFVSLGVSASDPKDLGFYLAKYFLNKDSSTFLKGILLNNMFFSLCIHCPIQSSSHASRSAVVVPILQLRKLSN